MKILWLAHRDPLHPRAGGAERIIYEVGIRLTKNGNEVSVLSGGWKNCKNYENLDGIHIIRYGHLVGPHLSLPIILLKNRYDIVIADLGHAVPWISPILFGKKTIVFFLHLHARSLPGQVGKMLARSIAVVEKLYFIIYSKQHFVTISSTSYNDLINLGVKQKRISIINPGVKSELFQPAKKTEFPSMVYFGGMRPYKRPEEALYLLKKLSKDIRNLQLTVIGDGPSRSSLEQLSLELDIMDEVVFTGRIPDGMVSELVSASWLNIHSSVTEGWGISIIEAASAGTPTVAYKVPGVSDSIESGLNGITVESGDRTALVKAALTILNDPKKWWSSSIEVAKKYSWDRTAESWDKVINEVVKE